MATGTDSALQKPLSIFDLEDPILRARHSAKILDMLLGILFESKHPVDANPNCTSLLVEEDELNAINHAICEVLKNMGEVYGKWETLLHQGKPSTSGAAP